jgi:thiopeptide-type bacteriocin biosynthesis protein
VEQTLVRYVSRAAARSTPFGLFAGCSLGELGGRGETKLELGPLSQARKVCRFDMEVLDRLASDLVADERIFGKIGFRPNSSGYGLGGQWRYAVEHEEVERAFRLTGIERTPVIEAVLDAAAGEARFGELVEVAMAAAGAGAEERSDVEAFVRELIDLRVLSPTFGPLVTGTGGLRALVDALREVGVEAELLTRLERLDAELVSLEAEPLGLETARYEALARAVREGSASWPSAGASHASSGSSVFQADLEKPGDLVLGEEVVREIERGVELLRRLPGVAATPFEAFARRFRERYGEGVSVRLVEVLDEETGIGFDSAESVVSDPSPLLAGLGFSLPSSRTDPVWTEWHAQLLGAVVEAAGERREEVDLDVVGIPRPAEEIQPLPQAAYAIAQIAASSADEVRRGEFDLFLRVVAGPSGARMLGRFCHLGPCWEEAVREHIRREEALRPDAVFAEIVHLPWRRLGNLVQRPVLRAYEIPFLGRSGAPEDRQIPIEDLRVSVRGDRVILTSERLGREVLPRLTTAHNFSSGGIALYRFLCALQTQGVVPSLAWSWGPLGSLEYLPRVRSGRLVLCRARWRISGQRLAEILADPVARGDLPRHVVVAEGTDQELLVDLESALSRRAGLEPQVRRRWVTLTELFPPPDRLCARSPEGAFVHELVVPFTAGSEVTRPAAPTLSPVVPAESVPAYPPGSEWLYLKVYAGAAVVDEVLRSAVAPLVQECREKGWIDRWFFLRYNDPEWHLRLRLHGAPERLLGAVLPLARRHFEPFLEGRQAAALTVDTYRPEVPRYGGPAALEIAERMFHCDSEIALRWLMSEAEGSELPRWLVCLAGLERMLDDLGLDAAGSLRVAQRMRADFTEEWKPTSTMRRRIGGRYRAERANVERLIDRRNPFRQDDELVTWSERLKAHAEAWRGSLESAGSLDAVEAIAASFVHLRVNRLMRSQPRAHELVLYEFLFRHLMARKARGGASRLEL